MRTCRRIEHDAYVDSSGRFANWRGTPWILATRSARCREVLVRCAVDRRRMPDPLRLQARIARWTSRSPTSWAYPRRPDGPSVRRRPGKRERPRCNDARALSESGARDGGRTRDPQLGKLMLYQLSYSRVRSRLAEPMRRMHRGFARQWRVGDVAHGRAQRPSSMLRVSVRRRNAWGPMMGWTPCNELKVLMNSRAWLGTNSTVRSTSHRSYGICRLQ